MADTMPKFTEFFHALWDHEPFPWQTTLAYRVSGKGGKWPQRIDLPTASGKTACIDIAVYALAAQADFSVSKRTAPRRIWFVVDRRIVVDEAYERACRIADKLRKAKDGSLKTVAENLRQLFEKEKNQKKSGLAEDARPLATARLRGGVLKDDGWARIPSQPALITSTVDQLGSYLLFRSYAHGQKTAPIFAGLAANDSIIFLDEAHCSKPFAQTLKAIQKFKGEKWAEEPIRNPFAFVTMSATPGNQRKENDVFPQDGGEKEKALDHELLQKRIRVPKRAELHEIKKSAKAENEDPLIEKAVELAREKMKMQKAGETRLKIALIVNRVATAESLAKKLREKMEDRADVVLLTGRFRPYERDVLVEEWKRYLKASDAETPKKPILFVSTQCIEVGADFSFDLMITECASLDALRQRFGRVNRLGEGNESHDSAVLIRDSDLKKKDPIYGESKKKTWEYLEKESEKVESENGATEDGKAKKSKKKAKQKSVVDFGIRAMDKFIEEKIGDLESCLAPALDAPILLPAHLDMLCQTHPVPHPAPDVDLFLHGKDRGAPEARILWRANLNDKNRDDWQEIIAACPPTSLETLSVPLFRLRQWLKTPKIKDDLGDVEGLAPEDDEEKDKTEEQQNRHFLRWRGRRKEKKREKEENPSTAVLEDPKEIAPGDLVVVPADYGIDGLGHSFLEESERKGVGKKCLDIWEAVQKEAGKAPALRLTSAIEQVKAHPQMREFLERIESEEPSDKEIRERIEELKDWQPAEEENDLPKRVRCFLERNEIQKIEKHPSGGIILFGKAAPSDKEEDDLFADEDDLASASPSSVPLEYRLLENHLAEVACIAEKLAKHCLPKEFSPALFQKAGQWHDAGKLDERFQVLLRNDDELAAFGKPLAKSDRIPASPQRRRDIRESAGLPEHFRHEMLSLQLAERFAQFSEEERDLILHLIASHHGCARPFAPICEEKKEENEPPPAVSGTVNGCKFHLGEEERQELTPPHQLDSGVPERFWRLTRRYGWWGLAYLESVLRLADWRASRNPQKPHE